MKPLDISAGAARFFQLGLSLIFPLLLYANTAFAHRVTVFGWVEGKTVFIEGKFSGGKPVSSGGVTVFNGQGRLLQEGVTDANGAFSFQTDHPEPMRIELDAGMGHKAHWVIGQADLEAETAATTAGSERVVAAESVNSSPPAAATAMTDEQVERVVERVLERKLRPVYQMLAEQNSKSPTLQDILGGIGYILGLVGLSAYVRYRNFSGEN